MSRTRPVPELKMAGRERATYGAIFSLRHADTGATDTMHLAGPILECARRLASVIDDTGEPWKVVCVSTPSSIYRDLQGSRNLMATGYHPTTGNEMSAPLDFDPIRGERNLFCRIGRHDLLPSVSNARWMRHAR